MKLKNILSFLKENKGKGLTFKLSTKGVFLHGLLINKKEGIIYIDLINEGEKTTTTYLHSLIAKFNPESTINFRFFNIDGEGDERTVNVEDIINSSYRASNKTAFYEMKMK
jgi:hypothetical protein